MSRNIASYLPPGWKLVDSRKCSCGDEAFVLAEKADARPDDTQFVTWEVDLRQGGCYHGRYTDSWRDATDSLEDRFRRHEGKR